MPKFNAYLRGEGTVGPTGPTGNTGPAGPSQTILFDVDVSSGNLICYTDYNIDLTDDEFKKHFSLDDTGHLWVNLQ